MVVQEFLDRMGKMDVLTHVGLDDWFDRLNFIITVWILMMMCSITTVKTYFLQPIICYIPNIIGSHEGQSAYITNYCYTEGTYNVPLADFKVDNGNPRWMDAYKDKKIYYYQWLPFVLGLQGIMCYLPRIVWQLFVNNRSGIDLTQLVRQTQEVQKAEGDRREKLVKHLCRQVELWVRGNMLIHNRQLKNGGGCFGGLCAKITAERDHNRQSQDEVQCCGATRAKVASDNGPCKDVRRCCMDCTPRILFSKRLGTWLVALYFIVKLAYIANAGGQLLLMTRLLQLPSLTANQNSSFLRVTATFGVSLLADLLQGKDWQNTEAFPRSGCCAIETRQTAGAQYIFAQCALPVNMIHEKVFIFLWFWFVLLLALNVASVPLWLLRFFSNWRSSCVLKYLRLAGAVSKGRPKDMVDVDEFCREFLRFDGIFLVHMLALNAGEVVATEMCKELFDIYINKYQIELDDCGSGVGDARRRREHRHENGGPRSDHSLGDNRPLVSKCSSSSSLNKRGGARRGLHVLDEEVVELNCPALAETMALGGREPSAPPPERSV